MGSTYVWFHSLPLSRACCTCRCRWSRHHRSCIWARRLGGRSCGISGLWCRRTGRQFLGRVQTQAAELHLSRSGTSLGARTRLSRSRRIFRMGNGKRPCQLESMVSNLIRHCSVSWCKSLPWSPFWFSTGRSFSTPALSWSEPCSFRRSRRSWSWSLDLCSVARWRKT